MSRDFSYTVGLNWGQLVVHQNAYTLDEDPMMTPIFVPLSGLELHGSLEEVLSIISRLVGRHDVLRASFEFCMPLKSLSLLDGKFPTQTIFPSGPVQPLRIELKHVSADDFSPALVSDLTDSYRRSGVGFLPIVIELMGGWMAAAMVSHLVIDGVGGQILRAEYKAIREGKESYLRSPLSVRRVFDLESSKDYRSLSERNLNRIGSILETGTRRNLILPRPKPVAEVATLESSGYAKSTATLSSLLGTSRATLSTVMFAVLLSHEFGSPQAILKTFFRPSSPLPQTSYVAPHALLAYLRLEVDGELGFGELVARLGPAVVAGYRGTRYSPVGADSVARRVAGPAGAELLDAIPGFNYLPSSESVKGVPQPEEKIFSTTFEEPPAVSLPMIAGLAIFERRGFDWLSLLGGGWERFRDSLHFLVVLDRLAWLAERNPNALVRELLDESLVC